MSTAAVVVDTEKHDPRYVTLQKEVAWISTGVWGLVWLAIGAIMGWSPLPHAFRIPLFVLWGLATVGHAWWEQYRPALAYRHESFRLDDDGIEIHKGILWRSVITIPRSRVQHTDVSQGPFERRHGLGTLAIYTAGVSDAVVGLPGLDHARALAIRDSLLPRARVGSG